MRGENEIILAQAADAVRVDHDLDLAVRSDVKIRVVALRLCSLTGGDYPGHGSLEISTGEGSRDGPSFVHEGPVRGQFVGKQSRDVLGAELDRRSPLGLARRAGLRRQGGH